MSQLKPDTVMQWYGRLAERLGIATTFHKLRDFSATELIIDRGSSPRSGNAWGFLHVFEKVCCGYYRRMSEMYTPLVSALDLDDFVKVEGFEVSLFWRSNESGWALRFVDGNGESLAEFPWWDHVERDLARWNSSNIPGGTASRPFGDFEQSWFILIWRIGDDVFIAQADSDDEPDFRERWRVSNTDYLAAWNATLFRAQEIVGEG
ncbi:hypothetical protein [Amycolatopsis sp. GM8]|uniref:hypothetical protein n=1 Tax=Amycolatopsis sp. GM8 TaxID=2896530 RepID=UPI001F2645A3|nr:hypothetical protein [Amycolatopsis sp. GM8]